jgi:hypothetical protein
MTEETACFGPETAPAHAFEEPSSTAARACALVDQWLLESFRVGPIAETTATMNAAYHAAQNLKTRLAALFKEG